MLVSRLCTVTVLEGSASVSLSSVVHCIVLL